MGKIRKKNTGKRKEPENGFNEYYIIVALLILVFSIFAYTAFVKIPELWGINYLYHLPDWEKMLFLAAGAAVLLPAVNRKVSNYIRK